MKIIEFQKYIINWKTYNEKYFKKEWYYDEILRRKYVSDIEIIEVNMLGDIHICETAFLKVYYIKNKFNTEHK